MLRTDPSGTLALNSCEPAPSRRTLELPAKDYARIGDVRIDPQGAAHARRQHRMRIDKWKIDRHDTLTVEHGETSRFRRQPINQTPHQERAGGDRRQREPSCEMP